MLSLRDNSFGVIQIVVTIYAQNLSELANIWSHREPYSITFYSKNMIIRNIYKIQFISLQKKGNELMLNQIMFNISIKLIYISQCYCIKIIL
jgi:hypothetical protein